MSKSSLSTCIDLLEKKGFSVVKDGPGYKLTFSGKTIPPSRFQYRSKNPQHHTQEGIEYLYGVVCTA